MPQKSENKNDESNQYISWDDERYSINNEEIDSQHKKLIDICNSLYDSHQRGDTIDGIRNALLAIVEYARTHFKDEEGLMSEIGFPGLNRQKKSHREFLDRITGFLQELRRGHQISALRLLAFLKNWIEDHIENEDKLIGSFLKAKKAEV
ncbi:MAG: bacteriohemerythrin [candidate division Zixibacteria bacterium]|nr:bacteriohemerythrin [candidate division Zixibacteria bacterium]